MAAIINPIPMPEIREPTKASAECWIKIIPTPKPSNVPPPMAQLLLSFVLVLLSI